MISEKTHWWLEQKADVNNYDFRQDSLVFWTESGFFQELRFQTRPIGVWDRKRSKRIVISDKTLGVLDRKRISSSTISDKTHWCLGKKADYKKCDFRQDSLVFGTESGFQEVRFQTRLFRVWDTNWISRSVISARLLDFLERKRISGSTISEKIHWCLGQKADFKKYDFRQDSSMFGTESGFQEVRF